MRKYHHTTIAFIILMLFSTLLQAQEITPKALLNNSKIIIGDQVTLRLDVEYSANMKIGWPNLPDSLTEFVEIVERSPVDSTITSNNLKRKWQDFVITSFDSGTHVIPPFVFAFSYNGMSDSVKSNSLELEVHTLPKLDSLMNALKGPIDIKEPYDAPLTFKEIAPWILGGLLAFGLIFLLLYSLRRKRNNQPLFSFPQKPKEPAHITALRELDRIKEEKIWQQGKTKMYYSELTDVLRQYISTRFGIPAMEQTSEETIAAFKFRRSLVDEKSFDNLRKILTNADLVKFAKYEPLPDDNNMALVDSYFFVNQTKIVEIIEDKKPPVDDREGEDVILK